MDKKSVLLIVNPASGKGRARTELANIIPELCKGGRCLSVCVTERSGSAFHYAKEYGSKYDIVACVGGDGTLSEVINGIMALPPEQRPTLGYIPTGTANDVASTLELSKNTSVSAARILEGAPIKLDVGRLGDIYFGYIAAFGAFTEVSYSTPQDSKKALGHLAYVLEGMTKLPTLSSYEAVVEYDGGRIEGSYVFGGVINSTSVAGLVKLDPNKVSLNDGMFEILLVKTPKKLSDLNSIVTKILTKNYDNDNVILLHSKKVRFTFNKDVAWTRDGELAGVFREIEAETMDSAISLII